MHEKVHFPTGAYDDPTEPLRELASVIETKHNIGDHVANIDWTPELTACLEQLWQRGYEYGCWVNY